LNTPSLLGGIQGVIVQSLADGSIWYERNPHLLLLPASNQKLFTSAAALHLLGPDWRYLTPLLRYGRVDRKGTLHGNLYLKGSGDPSLSDKDLYTFVQAVHRAGIRRIRGRVIGDESRFDRRRYGDGWSWDDMSYYYSPQISALNLNGNLVWAQVNPGKKVGAPLRVIVTPTSNYVQVVNRAVTTAKGTRIRLVIERELGKNRILIEGTLALDAPPDTRMPQGITLENPALYAAHVLTKQLRSAGIRVDGSPTTGTSPRRAHEIARHYSPPLSTILKRLHKTSDNLIAECLLKTLGAEKGKTQLGTTEHGIRVAKAALNRMGIDPDTLVMADGSGLSRHNLVSAHSVAALLRTMYAHPHAKTFLDSLPLAGVEGTLKRRLKGTPAENNVRAKTGTMRNVSCLSGYVTTRDGEPLLFVILMNNHRDNAAARDIQDKIVSLLASWQKMLSPPAENAYCIEEGMRLQRH
ncbi:MAG TPA: D-alanyl-D-alanine carboxypeptidase/D-alanyl-D-alanine-endopeptidase, partial [Chthonomonadales bacterium]|nr:D-alanyl-D-alanine carboxypeptidase/D-alanyl-D-alanine-endopeptidase [Chthonomonadales bacterium]